MVSLDRDIKGGIFFCLIEYNRSYYYSVCGPEESRKVIIDKDTFRSLDLSSTNTELILFGIDQGFDHPRREVIWKDGRRDSEISTLIRREVRLPERCILEYSTFLFRESSFLSITGSSFFSE